MSLIYEFNFLDERFITYPYMIELIRMVITKGNMVLKIMGTT